MLDGLRCLRDVGFRGLLDVGCWMIRLLDDPDAVEVQLNGSRGNVLTMRMESSRKL